MHKPPFGDRALQGCLQRSPDPLAGFKGAASLQEGQGRKSKKETKGEERGWISPRLLLIRVSATASSHDRVSVAQ